MHITIRQEYPLTPTAPVTFTDATTETNGATGEYLWLWMGPLTTLWTQPSSCSQVTTYLWDAGYGLAIGSLYPVNLAYFQDCRPPVIGGTLSQPTVTPEYNYYSPALCPSGWSAERYFGVDVRGETRSLNFFGTRTTGSAFACCPESYSVWGWEGCSSLIASGQTVTNLWQPTGTVEPTILAPPSSSLINSTMTADVEIFANIVFISFEPSDTFIVQNFQSQSQGPLITNPSSQKSSSGTSSSKASETSSSPGTNVPSTKQSGLSAGARAGIAIGIIVLFIAIVLVIFFYFRRRGRAKAKPNNPHRDRNEHEFITPANMHEMSTKHNVPEMAEQNQKTSSEPISGSSGREDYDSKNNIVASKPEDAVHLPQELDSETKIIVSTHEDAVNSPQELGESPLRAIPFSKAVTSEKSQTGIQQNDDENPAPDIREKIVDAPTSPTSYRAPETTTLSLPSASGQGSHPTEDKDLARLENLPALSAESESSSQINIEAAEKEEMLKLLRERRDEIRRERERLERLQELKDLEEATEREIAETEKMTITR